LSEKLGVHLRFKRDDLTGCVLSGNKVRKLEFPGNFAVGKLAQNHGRSGKWGPYPAGSKNFAGVNQWEYMNTAKFVRENPTVELPYWLCWPAYGAYPAHTIGDFGFMPWPEMFHAMHATKRAFAAVWNANGPGEIGDLRTFVRRLRRDQSLPAFGRCSLDASPGDGAQGSRKSRKK